jgi:hypothetical protein
MSFQPPDGGQWLPPQSQPPPSQASNGKAIAALVLGILGLVACPLVCSILALVFGYQGRGEIDRSGGWQSGRGLAVAGIVLGWVGIALTVLIVIVIGVVAASGGFEDPTFETY